LDLVIVHNHFRPGGVRRVIELGTPFLVKRLKPPVRRVMLVSGEGPAESWWRTFQDQLAPVPVVCHNHPALKYVSEQPRPSAKTMAVRVRTFLSRLFAENSTKKAVVWAHNQALGRNLLLTRELERLCRRLGLLLIFHHHDWWFDNRWQRWPEIRASGFGSLSRVAQTVFPVDSSVRHVAINQHDAAVLQHHFPQLSGWVPNPASVTTAEPLLDERAMRRWVHRQIGTNAPLWVMPCRLLRRKNVAEALLLARWLRPGAWLVTTAGVSSPEEQPYAARLNSAAKRYGWPLRLSVLAETEGRGPTVADLLAASETVLLTSLQEGFGLPFIEAAAARRPLIARALPNITPDLAKWGLALPQAYDELYVDTNLFDWWDERKRQAQLFWAWRDGLPKALRRWTGQPALLDCTTQPDGVPFSRLTLSAQIELLTHPAEVSWTACLRLNPWLNDWRVAATTNRLRLTPWPNRAVQRLSGSSFARSFAKLLRSRPASLVLPSAGVNAQREFMRERLLGPNLYPLTWSSET